MSIRFERLSLYEEVWSTPLTKLGEKYGLSDNGIRKICKALNIPLPRAGHWAKIAAGYQISRAPLPKESDKTEYISNPKPVAPVTREQDEDLVWLKEREEFELNPTNKISVDLKPKKFHVMLMETRKLLAEKLKESQKFKIEAEKKAKRLPGRNWEPHLNSGLWKQFERNGQLLELHKRGMPFRLTPTTCDRGLAIANALFFAAESRGFEIIKDEESRELGFKLNDGTVYIRISEKLKDEVREVKNPSFFDTGRIKIPTGVLRLHLCAFSWTTQFEVSDSADNSLQEKLNQVFCRIYKLIIRSRAQHREWAEYSRQCEMQRQQQDEREKIHQENVRLREMELQRRADLLKEAEDWQSSELLYRYIAHRDNAATMAGIDILQDEHYLEWKNWALKAANELDPTFRSFPQQNDKIS